MYAPNRPATVHHSHLMVCFVAAYALPAERVDYTRIGSNKGKTPEHSQRKGTLPGHGTSTDSQLQYTRRFHRKTLSLTYLLVSSPLNTYSIRKGTTTLCNVV